MKHPLSYINKLTSPWGLVFPVKKRERPDNTLEIRRQMNQKSMARILLATQPKAGTYLLSALLSELGFHQTYYHLGPYFMQAYDPTLMELNKNTPAAFTANIPIKESLFLVRNGEFAASHLPPLKQVAEHLSYFKVISARRELRSMFRSKVRFIVSTQRVNSSFAEKIKKEGIALFLKKSGRHEIKTALKIAEWERFRNAFTIKMEDLTSNPEEIISNLAAFLEKEVNDPEAVWQKVQTLNTITRSEGYIPLDWTEDDEKIFRKIGGVEANRALGYEEDK